MSILDHNRIAENIFALSFRQHFQCIRDATQSCVSLQQEVYAASQVVCVKRHCKKDECKCICSETNNLNQIYIRNKPVPIKKKRKSFDCCSRQENDLKRSKNDDDELLESPFCVPVEELVFVNAMTSQCKAKNKYFCVYILQSETDTRRTYCGITNNRQQRLRRHNGIIKGGAHQTRANRPWRMVAVLNGFKNISEAQSFEWSMHNPQKRKLKKPFYGVEGRFNCLHQLLSSDIWCDRFTTKPVKISFENSFLTGSPIESIEFLRGKENECEIHYADDQLRLYIADSERTCLSKQSLCELEMYFCKNNQIQKSDV